MANQKVQVEFIGNAGPLMKSFGEASQGAKKMAKEMEAVGDGIKGTLAGLAAPLAALAALAGGTAFFKGTIEETKNWTVEAQKLARVLGITTEQASVLNLAIGDVYSTQEEYLGAVSKLTRTLNTNEEAFHRLGVTTRDQNGNLRDTPSIMAEVNGKLAQMTDGTARNVAASQIYGKSWMEILRLLDMTPEKIQAAQEKAEKLNLIVGQDSVAATDAYRASMNDLEDTVKGLKIGIGKELIPVVTQFNTLLSEAGPPAISAMSGFIREFNLICLDAAKVILDLGDKWDATMKVLSRGAEYGGKALGSFAKADLRGAVDAWKDYEFQLEMTGEALRANLEANDLLINAQKSKWDGSGDGNMGPQPPPKAAKRNTTPPPSKDARTAADKDQWDAYEALWNKHLDDLFEVYATSLEREERKTNQHYADMLARARAFGADEQVLAQVEIEREVAIQNLRTEAAAKASEERRKIEREEAEERRRHLEEFGTFQQGFLDGIGQYIAGARAFFKQGADTAMQLLQGLENAFARSIQGILTGQVRGWQILKSIWVGVIGAIVQILAQMAAKFIVTAIAAKLFKDKTSEAAKSSAIAQQQAAAASLWATYSGIPFAGPALAAGFIAMMNATLIANSAAAKGIVGAAEGGWFDRPTLTMIGEGKRPELVVPDVAFKDFAANLSANILRQERQAQGYRAQASSFASAAPGGGGGPRVENHYHQNAPVWGADDRSFYEAGQFFDRAQRVYAQRSGQVLDSSQPYGARI